MLKAVKVTNKGTAAVRMKGRKAGWMDGSWLAAQRWKPNTGPPG